MRSLIDQLAVYLVADPAVTERDLLTVVEQALAGGVTAVQLRAKLQSDRTLLDLACAIAGLCRDRPKEALFIVNDRVDLALAAGADGVHLGVDDLPIAAARQIGGPDFIIGYSPETDQQAANARQIGADYLGVGPVFATSSKSDAGRPIGIDGLARRAKSAGIPIIGIGGIAAGRAGEVIEAGAVGVAVASAILHSPDPKAAAIALACAVGLARGGRDA